jgi:hypothetical protein
MKTTLALSIVTVLCLAVPAVPAAGQNSLSPAISAQAVIATELLALPGDTTLGAMTEKQIKKTKTSIAKAAKKKAKIDAKLAARMQVLADAQAQLQQLLAAEPAASTAYLTALESLQYALALPAATPAEKATRAAALKIAKSAKKSTKKTLNKIQKGIARLQKKVAKTQVKVTALSTMAATQANSIGTLGFVLDVLSLPFDFQMTQTVPVRIQVLDSQGKPVSYARVSWTDVLALPDPNASGGKTAGNQPIAIEDIASVAVYAQGFADANGRLELEMDLPSDVQTVDMIVQAEGYTGPYTDEGLRALWDVFAPSSRMAVTRQALKNFTVTLAAEDAN